MNFSDKTAIFDALRKGIAPDVRQCKAIDGKKRDKTAPINDKLWRNLYSTLLRELEETALKAKWSASAGLDARLRLFYCALVVNLESRNAVFPYDYMDFARRVGEVWEDFCKVCWDAPVNNNVGRLAPLRFATVQAELLGTFAALVAKGLPTNTDKILGEFKKIVDLLGNINLTEDEYCAVGDRRIVIDFKSGFGSNEKGNTERLLTVAKIYKLLPERHECVLVVRAPEGEGNNYLKRLKQSGLWTVCCGPDAYAFIKEVTGFDLALWIRKNVAFHEDMETAAYQHLNQLSLTKYLGW